MAKPRSDALRLIDWIYRFPGGLRGPGEVDIERPVSIVHDAAPAAGRSACIEYVFEQTQITAGDGSLDYQSLDKLNLITSIASIRKRARNLGLTVNNSDVWLLGVSAAITNASKAELGNLAVFLYPEIIPAELYGSLVAFYDTLLDVGAQDPPTYVWLYAGTEYLSAITPLPRRVGQIRTRADDAATGAAEYSLRFQVAICPKGVNPQPL